MANQHKRRAANDDKLANEAVREMKEGWPKATLLSMVRRGMSESQAGFATASRGTGVRGRNFA